MIRSRVFPPSIEPLESRIAPAAVLTHPLADISSGTVVDLSHLLDPGPARTQVTFTTNFDVDSTTPGLQAGLITIELYDDLAPRTVANFLSYVNTLNVRGDYDDTFIHRIFDFGTGSDAGIDIIQGGGFETDALQTHIPTGPTVVNEYRNDLPNERGTIAMAKLGGDPNSATSEWFFNVTNNSTILGAANNGGFAVFGHVISGLSVLDKIALASKTNLGGALTDLPVQKLASGAEVTPANLISFTDVKVVPGPKGDVTGTTFEVISVTDFNDPAHPATDLLTATVVGSDLNLTYSATKSGVATVKIRATQNGSSVEDEFNVTVKPNLHADITADGLSNLILPGSSGNVSVQVSNNGLAVANTHVDVKFYLSKIDSATEPNGIVVDAKDLLIGTLTNQAINIAGGSSVTLSGTIDFAKNQLIGGNIGNEYKLIAQVTPTAGSTLDELFTADNVAIDGKTHSAANLAGTFTDSDNVLHKNVVLTYAEADGSLVTVSFRGSGFAELTTTDGLVDYRVGGTTASSTFTVKTATGGDVVIHDLAVTSQIGTIALGQANLAGKIAISGGAKSITLGDVASDSRFVIGGFAPANTQKAAIRLGHVTDVEFESLMPIGTLSALSWLDTTGTHDSISAVSIDTLKITDGNLEADLYTSSSAALRSVAVSGVVKNSTIQINGALGKFAASALDHSSLTTLGGARLITTGDVVDSSFILGTAGSSAGSKGTLRFGRVSDTAVTAFTPLASLTAVEWLDADGSNERIAAPSLGSLIITGRTGASPVAGNFAADLTLTGTAALSKFSVAGLVQNAAIHTTGDVRTATVGGFDQSELFVGTSAFPNTLAAVGDAALGSLTVRGAFTDSQVAAARIGTVKLSSAAPTGGFVADAIKSYNRDSVRLRNLDAPGTFDSLADYEVTIL